MILRQDIAKVHAEQCATENKSKRNQCDCQRGHDQLLSCPFGRLAACSSGPSVSCRLVGGDDDTQFYVSSDDCAMSALGQKQTFAPQKAMSALPPQAGMCGAVADVRYGPKADICS